jgi:cbb3-type cytochrome c oxidase subunit II
MWRAEKHFAGWRGTALVTATYVYFLIFAQFGFLKRLDEQRLSDDWLKAAMGAMALGGILASLLTGRVLVKADPRRRLQSAWSGCAAGALLTLLNLSWAGFLLAAACIGISLGLLTVTLVTHLRAWTGPGNPVYKVAFGTGLGYLICNYPPLFTAGPRTIAVAAAGCCAVGIAAASRKAILPEEAAPAKTTGPPFGLVLLWFTVLIWFDSAAFFIIQNSPALKAGTWEGARRLWVIGGLHFCAALAGGYLLRKRGTASVLTVAFVCLAAACLCLDGSHAGAAAMLYPVGVSLYSVALVVYPSLLTGALSEAARCWRAGLIYAVAGWIGSAMGIGMAQNLHMIPQTFIAGAGALFVVPLAWRAGIERKREAAAVLGVAALAFLVWRIMPRTTTQEGGAIAEGRRVYISEGCISCHSQYVRPHSPDVAMWGPTQDVESVRRQKPPLIGNRRQGPDLSEVGSRRSALWLRIHLIDPRAVSYRSVMPSYAYLFSDSRGDDLVKYLANLRSAGSDDYLRDAARKWQPNAAALERGTHSDGRRLFEEHCATCHEAGGRVRIEWGWRFRRLPPDLSAAPEMQPIEIARIIKFGIPGTDMAGHEYLPDDQVEAMANYVASLKSETTASHRRGEAARQTR